jgi:DNA polymerase-3 subunit alpha
MTRRGRMLVIKLDDATAQVEISAYAELLEKSRDRVKEDSLLVVLGKAQRDEFTGGLRVIAEELLDLAALRSRYATELRLDMNGQADAKRLMAMLAPYRAAQCQVLVHYENGAASCDVRLGDGWRVSPDERLLGELCAWLARRTCGSSTRPRRAARNRAAARLRADTSRSATARRGRAVSSAR